MLNINFKELLKEIKQNKKLLATSLIVNFFILPLIAYFIWLAIFHKTHYEILYWMLILSIIPWWWLLTAYLKMTKANLHLWISLFGINLLLFWLYFIPFSAFLWTIKSNTKNEYNSKLSENKIIPYNFSIDTFQKTLNYNFNKTEENKNTFCIIEQTSKKLWLPNTSCFSKNWKINILIWLYWFIILIVLPVILKIFVNLTKISNYLKKSSNMLSKFWTFIVISYIFALKEINIIFSQKIKIIFLKTLLLVFIFYTIDYTLGYLISALLTKNKQNRLALFFNLTTRFITLGLIIGSVYAYYLNDFKILVVFILSYFFQIFLSFLAIKLKL